VHTQVSQWLGILQAVVMVPVMLRFLRRRYKMPWTCLLHSQLYLAVQAIDLAAVASLAADAGDRALRLTAEVSVYLASIYLDSFRLPGFCLPVCVLHGARHSTCLYRAPNRPQVTRSAASHAAIVSSCYIKSNQIKSFIYD